MVSPAAEIAKPQTGYPSRLLDCVHAGQMRSPEQVSHDQRSSYDLCLMFTPIAVAKQTLVQLSGRQPRQFSREVNRSWDLLSGQLTAAELDQFVGEYR